MLYYIQIGGERVLTKEEKFLVAMIIMDWLKHNKLDYKEFQEIETILKKLEGLK